MKQIGSQRRRTQPSLGSSPRTKIISSPQLSAAESSRPLWFDSGSGPLFGFYHPPRHRAPSDATRIRRLGILLCPPFGYEAMCAYRPYRRLAEQLAEHGFPVLRFDYHGTGNSAGDDRDPGRVAAWLKNIDAAIDQLERLSGCRRVGLFGTRLSATMAAVAAGSRSDVAALALWGPSLTGKTFLREELAVHKLRAQQRAARTSTAPAPDADGEVLGFVLTAETSRDIKALELSSLARAPASALVLARDTPLQEPHVVRQLADLGAHATLEDGAGYAAMIETSHAPAQIWERLERYFDAQDRALGDDLPTVSNTPRAHAPEPSISLARSRVRETACWFAPERGLFGVLTEQAPRTRTGRPVILLLSGGVNPQVGTNRMHTRWARAWAELGFSTFRFDLAGVGDSHTRAGEQDGQLYTLAGVADVQAAMDHLGSVCGARTFMLVGLCSGAFVAFHTALADRRVTHIGLLNLLRFYWDAADTIERVQAQRRHQLRSVRYYLGAATSREHLQKLLSGRVDLARIADLLLLRAARRTLHAAAYWLGRLSGAPLHPVAAHPLARDFLKLAQRGIKSLVVYDGDEPMLDDFREQLGADVLRLEALGALQVEVIDGADHIFSPIASQETLTARLTEYVQRLSGEAVA
jgi:pimeloyl-ACP methyl ester carboxylesterase